MEENQGNEGKQKDTNQTKKKSRPYYHNANGESSWGTVWISLYLCQLRSAGWT
jgi:hypothetical protein